MGILDAPAISRAQLDAVLSASTITVNDGFGGTFPTSSRIGPPYVYKPPALARWAKALGSQLVTRAEVLFQGDSTIAGIGSDNSPSGAETTTSILNSVPGQVRSLIAAKTFIDPGEGLIMPTDSRWVLAGGATVNSGTASGPLMRHINLPNASATATIQLAGTDFEVWWHKIGTLAAPTITIDGSAVTVAAGANGQNKVTIPAVAEGTHTIVITGNAAQSRISGIVARRNPTKGIGVHRMGIGGQTAATGAGETIPSTRADLFAVEFTNLSPALVIIQFSINDWLTQVPIATFKANLQLMISHIVTTLGKCVLLSDANQTYHDPASIGPITRAQYAAAMRQLCDENSHVAFVSQPSLLGTYTNLNAQGLMITNSSHPNAGGYGAVARGLTEGVLLNPFIGLV